MQLSHINQKNHINKVSNLSMIQLLDKNLEKLKFLFEILIKNKISKELISTEKGCFISTSESFYLLKKQVGVSYKRT